MIFQDVAYVKELSVYVWQNFCHLRNRHWCTNTSNYVFALSVHQEFAHQALFACCRVTCECYTCTAIVTHVTECHCLYVYCCTPRVWDVVVHTVDVSTWVVPRTEYCFYCCKELYFWIGWEICTQLSFVLCFELVSKFLEVVRCEFYVGCNALFFLHLVDEFFEIFFTNFHNNVGEHLDKSAVAVPSPTWVAGFSRKNFYYFLVKTEVQNCVHHTRHGCTCAGTNGNEKWIFLIAELFAGDFFHLFDSVHDLRFDFVVDTSTIFVVLCASFCRNCEALRYWKTNFGHFSKVCALTTKKFTHGSIAFTKQISILCCHCVIPPE